MKCWLCISKAIAKMKQQFTLHYILSKVINRIVSWNWKKNVIVNFPNTEHKILNFVKMSSLNIDKK